MYEKKTLVTLESHSFRGPLHDVVIERCMLHSVADSSASP